jgi:hypothetical protein
VEVVDDGRDVVGVPRVVGDVTWRCGGAETGGDVAGVKVVGGVEAVGCVEVVDIGSSTPSTGSASVGTAPKAAAIVDRSREEETRSRATADPATRRVVLASASTPRNTRRRRILVEPPGRCPLTVLTSPTDHPAELHAY